MIRALNEPVPEELLEFFRKSRGSEDYDRFWADLRHWYCDGETRTWYAAWKGFCFPAKRVEQIGPRKATKGSKARNTHRPRKLLSGEFVAAHFVSNADFSDVSFPGAVSFYWSTFEGAVSFVRTQFLGEARFDGINAPGSVTFRQARFAERATFYLASFPGGVDFTDAAFEAEAVFFSLRAQTATFRRTRFRGTADFRQAEMARGEFVRTVVETGLTLGLASAARGALELVEVGSEASEPNRPTGPSLVTFGSMSLGGVELRSLDGSELRFRDTMDIEALTIWDVEWPQTNDGRLRVADESDMARGGPSAPTSAEVERIYSALRKNYENRKDRANAQRWYVSEMEVGRESSPLLSAKRVARAFYKCTSYYGMRAGRPALLGALFVLGVFLLFLIPNRAICPVAVPVGTGPIECAGWTEVMRTVLLAVVLQDPPAGILLPGVASTLLWILLRIAGVITLASITVVYRNQVGR